MKGLPCKFKTLRLAAAKILRIHSALQLILFSDRSNSRNFGIEVMFVMKSGIDSSLSLRINVSKHGRDSSPSIFEILFWAKLRYVSLEQWCKFSILPWVGRVDDRRLGDSEGYTRLGWKRKRRDHLALKLTNFILLDMQDLQVLQWKVLYLRQFISFEEQTTNLGEFF